MWAVSLNTIPDIYKGMLKGLVGALALQRQTLWINLFCQWLLNLFLQWLFAFKLGMGLTGIWMAKITMECCIALAYTGLITCQNWEDKVRESAERRERDLIGLR